MGWIEERYCIAWELHYYTELRSYKELCTYIKKTFMMNRKMRIYAYSLFSLKELLPVMVVNMLSYFTRKSKPAQPHHHFSVGNRHRQFCFISFRFYSTLFYFMGKKKILKSRQPSVYRKQGCSLQDQNDCMYSMYTSALYCIKNSLLYPTDWITRNASSLASCTRRSSIRANNKV